MKPIWKRYEGKGSVNMLSSYMLLGLTVVLLLLTVFHNLFWLTGTLISAVAFGLITNGNAKILWADLRKNGLLAMKRASDTEYHPPYRAMISTLLMLGAPFFVVWIILAVAMVALGAWSIVFAIPAWVAAFLNFAAWQDAWVIDMCGKKKYYWGTVMTVFSLIWGSATVIYVIKQIIQMGGI